MDLRSRFNISGSVPAPAIPEVNVEGFDMFALQSMMAFMPTTEPSTPKEPTATNPFRPLSFESFGTATGKDTELEVDVQKTSNPESAYFESTEIEILVKSYRSDYAEEAMCDAAAKALEGYSRPQSEVLSYVEAALKIHAVCPEAYVLKALRCSSSFEEALELFRKAEELGPRVTPKLYETALKEKNMFEHRPLRAYFRAVHGVGSILRKLGKSEEALQTFMKLQELDDHLWGYMSYVNFRVEIPLLQMTLGQFDEAQAFILKAPHADTCFTNPATAPIFLWDQALLDYQGGLRTFPWMSWSVGDEATKQHDPSLFKGKAILAAIRRAGHVLPFLTGERGLPAGLVIPPGVIADGKKPSSVALCATYAAAHKQLWESVPGAIEWARKCYNTAMMFLAMNNEISKASDVSFPMDIETFRKRIQEGVFVDSSVAPSGNTLLHDAVLYLEPAHVRALLEAGASVKFGGTKQLSPLHFAAYYERPIETVKLLVEAGADPRLKVTVGDQEMPSPLRFAANQGNWKTLAYLLKQLDDKEVNLALLKSIFGDMVKSTVYQCTSHQGYQCARCLHDPVGKRIPHAPWISFERCVDILVHRGLRNVPSPRDLDHPLGQYLVLANKIWSKGNLATPSEDGIIPVPGTFCENCMKVSNLSRCSRCNKVAYCSRECQAANWSVHKKVCAKK